MARMSAVQGATPATAGEVLALIRNGSAVTRSAIAAVTGLSRTAVSARLAVLMESGLVVEGEEAPSGGGRPPATLQFNSAVGVVFAVAIGRSRTQLAVCDLAGRIQAQDSRDHAPGLAPGARMTGIVERLRSLLDEAGRGVADVRAIGISIPGTVDHDAGASLDSPLLPGWDGVPLAPFFAEFADAPVFLDNDANALAASETGFLLATYDDLLLVKVSTGLGVGIVVRGELVRGAWGAAGELGHLKSAAAAGRTCRCGEVGCLEAVAGGWALVQELSARGREVEHVRVLVALAREGDAEARALIRESGRRVGEVLAQAVNLLNPAAVVLGGDMAAAYDTFVAGFREGLYANAASVATRRLQVLQSTHGEEAGIVGCTSMAVESLLEPARLDRMLARPLARA
ncbi:ROK family transcriptional regulator [Nocardioides cavernaquae]|uniref:ROK family transcriptional regulator n=2 Tax=Nocardioides cavernaquae TaxID=2321396 RepID=A0A3A5H5X6_9ACTN|nr:ROK family transcriptional regulator [Nocardioides cavernaquae]